MASPALSTEYSAMPKRGPYRKGGNKPPPPAWRHNFIAKWREVRGMTQEALAERSGLSVGTISNLEAGTAGYSDEGLDKIARALRVTRGMLLDVDPTGNEPLWAIIGRADKDQLIQIEKHASVIVPEKQAKKR